LKEERQKDAHNHNVCLACRNRLEITISAWLLAPLFSEQHTHTFYGDCP